MNQCGIIWGTCKKDQKMNAKSIIIRLLVIYGVAMGINFVWEMAQMPLYQEMPFDEIRSYFLCMRASFGDANITISIFVLGLLLFRDWNWPAKLTIPKLAYLIISGGGIAILIELSALKGDRWAYASVMPLLPVVKIGLIPLLQLIVLPLSSYYLSLKISLSRE